MVFNTSENQLTSYNILIRYTVKELSKEGWNPGIITRVNENNTYDIQYDSDGSEAQNITQNYIRRHPESEPEPEPEPESEFNINIYNQGNQITIFNVGDRVEIFNDIQPGIYVIENVPQQYPIAILNQGKSDKISYDGYFAYKSTGLGPDGLAPVG